jgi:hypothetical protein
MGFPEYFAMAFGAFPICRRADFDLRFSGGFVRFELFLRFDRGGGTLASRLLK